MQLFGLVYRILILLEIVFIKGKCRPTVDPRFTHEFNALLLVKLVILGDSFSWTLSLLV